MNVRKCIFYFFLFNITDKGPEGHTAMRQCLTRKEADKYTNKLIKKTTDTKLQRILAVNQENLILANITMNDCKNGNVTFKSEQCGRWATMSGKLFQVLITRSEKSTYMVASMVQ